MTVPGNLSSPLLATAADAAAAAAGPTRSIRLNSADSAHLSRTPSSASNRRTWTLSLWFKRSASGNNEVLRANSSSTDHTRIYFANHKLHVRHIDGSTAKIMLQTSQVFRDFSGWMHCVVAVDTTAATNSDRVKLYINGSQVTDFGTETYPDQNLDTDVNATEAHAIGATTTGTQGFDGYFADCILVDGSQLDPTSFGAFDDSGVWQAAAYSGTYGTNGFHLLDFANESTVGHDSSGNENDFTANNISSQTTLSSYNLDVTSTPFQDIGTSISISNPSVSGQTAVSTTTAATNSFNLTTVADVGSANFLRSGSLTIPPVYTIDYYYRASGTQVSNARAIRSHDGTRSILDDYGSQTSRTLRLNDGSGNVDTTYSITDGAWNHVRITSTGVWVNGTSVQSSPPDIGGITVEYISHGGLKQSTSYQLAGEIGPVRIAPVDLGAPASGGLVANSDGTLTTLTGGNPSTDVLFDVPTNGDSSDDTGAGGEVSGNYATFNPLNTPWTLEDGNLEGTAPSSPTRSYCPASIYVNSGKWYAEIELTNNGGTHQPQIGVVRAGDEQEYIGYTGTGGVGYEPNVDRKYASGTATTSFYGQTYTSANYIFGLALDMDAGTLDLYVDGVSLGELASGLSGYYAFAAGDIRGAGLPNVIGNFGQRPFAYSAPSGYKALCTTNLPTPTIADGSDYFDAKTYSGNGGTQTVSSLSFEPDFLWVKCRNDSVAHYLGDTVRGINKNLQSNGTNAEVTNHPNGYVSAVTSNGFTVTDGSSNDFYTNGSSETYVAWAWDAGSSTVSNTDGDITSSCRTSTTSGFSIVSWTGNGSSNQTVGHNLGVVPELIIAKNRDTTNSWAVWTTGFNANEYLLLNSSGAKATFSGQWGSTPTSSVFGVNDSSVNGSGNDIIAYCFASVSGYQLIGTWTGNGSTDGPFVHTGFRPAALLWKPDQASTDWVFVDAERNTYNVIDNYLLPNTSGSEGTLTLLDFCSNGFKLRTSSTGNNTSGTTVYYIAWAENPFQANGGLAR